MNERIHTSIIVIWKMLCTLPPRRSTLGKHGFLRLFANMFKNNITSSIRHIIVCLLKTE